ncbi:prephenate dehydratase [Alicyclobacillus acidiphilus]|uniref:prephenate dehydratase n=1 Tax=Alicyclobacillus acidiphilus TaxID=182455 RepID=UPI00082F5342|nr:prephenate dehydratase domain-containing protein [Alicyclobacillus acidiphilus]
MNIYYLGPEGTHSHEAAAAVNAHFLGGEASVVARPTFPAVLEACFADAIDDAFACVPIENSIQGSVWQVWDGLTRYAEAVSSEERASACQMLAAINVPIHQYAVYPPNTEFGAVREVLSHPQALAQCDRSVKKLFPNAVPVAVSSTADAIRQVAERRLEGVVGIGSRRAAEQYGLDYYRDPIEDHPGNVTRFALIGKASFPLAQPVNLAKTDETASLCLRGVPHRPGGLVTALQTFADARLNLTRLESRPVGDQIGNYVYYVDVSIAGLPHSGEAELEAVIGQLADHGTRTTRLGTYPVYRAE